MTGTGAGVDLVTFHARLLVARDRLDTAWVRMAADLHLLALAVGDMIQAHKDTQT